jgi:hypothetical protein
MPGNGALVFMVRLLSAEIGLNRGSVLENQECRLHIFNLFPECVNFLHLHNEVNPKNETESLVGVDIKARGFLGRFECECHEFFALMAEKQSDGLLTEALKKQTNKDSNSLCQ